ncbi:protein kinase [bacterium]|nr:protein kinase [bacterium]
MNWETKFPQLQEQQRYTILDKIGEGGMAVVFLCLDNELDEKVALKILKPDLVKQGKTILQFKQEIKIARKITHRNICRIYDFGKFDTLHYIVMEYIPGTPLSSLIRKKDALPTDKKSFIALKILNGLEAAHGEKVVHRDLKPSNIILGKNFEPVIMDFGLARYAINEKITPESRIFGTPAYMSPEQITGVGVDHRADIYAFGLIFYELMTEHYPFDDTNYFKLLYSHVNDDPPLPTQIFPLIDKNIEQIIMRCLHKDPNERYPNVSQIISDLLKTYDQLSESTDKRTKKKVLIVDDERLLRTMLAKMFESLGLNVVEAVDGNEAVFKALEEKPDLICLDIMMPNMSGIEAAEIILSNPKTQAIPVVIFSCKDDNELMVYSRQIGIRDYLIKPIQLVDLKSRLNFWLQPNKDM